MSEEQDPQKTENGDTEGSELSEVSLEQELDRAEAAASGAGPEGDRSESVSETAFLDGDYQRRFSEFIGSLGIRYFQPREFLFLGGSHAPGERCAGRNQLPPEELWPNIARTARMLDEIRHRLGHPLFILSAYRSPSYNGCIGGEPGSLHMRFNAIDFAGRTGTASDWWQVARTVRGSDPSFEGGIGRYSGFVHIDTRGRRADW